MRRPPSSCLQPQCCRDTADSNAEEHVCQSLLLAAEDVHCAGKISPYAATGSPIFFMLKAFGAGVILATGFIHMWPDANSSFSNSCLGERPRHAWTALAFSKSSLTDLHSQGLCHIPNA